MKALLLHFKFYTLRGLLATVPIVITIVALRLVYVVIDERVRRVVAQVIRVDIPGMGLLITVLVLYGAGLISSNLLGKRMFQLIEQVTQRIPLIGSTYQVGKQLATTLSLPEREVFKRVVLVDYLKPGIWTIGFVTGVIIDKKNGNQRLLKVFVPTPPNPTSGTMVVAKESETRDPGWTVEEALKAVISGGIIGPDVIQ